MQNLTKNNYGPLREKEVIKKKPMCFLLFAQPIVGRAEEKKADYAFWSNKL